MQLVSLTHSRISPLKSPRNRAPALGTVMQTKRTKHYRTTSIGFSREDWELLMAIAEADDRFTKTVATELMSAAVRREAQQRGLLVNQEAVS